jgi:Family of unknown function (DUF6528)
MKSRIPWGAALVVSFFAVTAAAQSKETGRELIVCGWDEVFILDLDAKTETGYRRTWTWRAQDRDDLPAEFTPLFRTTDECKPLDGGSRILITSSGGGVALVSRADGRVIFYARAANAHSAELLPNDRVAVAASHDKAGKGDRLIVFDLSKPNVEILSEELPWGHGVVWDAQRSRLWALADKDIRVFELRDWDSRAPSLRRVETIPLPEGMGHNLSAAGGTAALAVSTTNHCWLFDRDTKTLRPHPELADAKHVKSISYHPATGQIAYVQAEGENWWAERIHFVNPGGFLHMAGEHFYKARWNVVNK